MAISNLKYCNSTNEVIKALFENRGIRTEKEKKEFLKPGLKKVTPQNVGIKKDQLKKAAERIKKAKKENEQVVVFGDYDADGLCGSAILWEILNKFGLRVLPYIPDRISEGYGLSKKAIQNLESRIQNVKLIITVDNGITANEAVNFANKEGIDVIITDHHVFPKELPKAVAIVHTTNLCGAGVAYLLAKEFRIQNSEFRIEDYLDLAAIATVADLVPLLGPNRTIVKYGLDVLRKTKRIGLLELFKEAGLEIGKIGTYDIGHIIAPRLNAMGRVDDPVDSLRLLCARNRFKAKELAQKLGTTNRKRQDLTQETAEHAVFQIRNSHLRQGYGGQAKLSKLLFISDESYQQGIIGLVAGKLVEEFYRPSIVISKGKIFSKASARSVKGFNIIEFIRNSSEFLVNAGGHPMAAGFTVETANLPKLQKKMEDLAEKLIEDNHLVRTKRIDCEIPLSLIGNELYEVTEKLEPFGMGNPTPSFLSKNAVILDMRLVGKDAQHLKLKIKDQKSNIIFDAIWFGGGEKVKVIHTGDTLDMIYSIDENVWNGNTSIQLKLKSIEC